MTKKTCDNILVRGVNWIGDAVMTTPALRALRLARPDARITLLLKPWVAALFEKDPNVDEIILYSDSYRGVLGKLRLASVLRKYGFCEAVLFQNAIDAALITFLAGIHERVGYSRDLRRLLLTRAVPFQGEARRLHHIDYYLNLLSSSGFEIKKTEPWIYLSLDERLQARERLSGLKRPVVAINPGAAFGSAKRWNPDRFADVARKICGEMKGSVVILGGPSETHIAGEIVDQIRTGKPEGAELYPADSSKVLLMAGRTSLRELAALISECDLLVTNDSGPMHIGYAVGTPVVAIFGSTSPELTGPVGGRNIIIRKDTRCSPCFRRECDKKRLECMDLITSEEVFAAVQRLLPSGRAVFFDRDGTLCRDAHYLSRIEDLEIFPEIGHLTRLKDKGFFLIGITNQSGVARGKVDERFVDEVNAMFVKSYGFDRFYYCPHHPRDHCTCRKPEPGLLFRAAADFGIDLRRSFVVGDKDSDMMLARCVGAVGIQVDGNEGTSMYADHHAAGLEDAVDRVLRAGAGDD